jgi:hypothetical protein
VSGTGDWSAAGFEDLAGLIAVRVGIWNHMEYPENVPAAGEHNAAAIKAGQGAVEAIDELIRHLHTLRGQLIDELRADEDARTVRVDAMLAEARARREAGR